MQKESNMSLVTHENKLKTLEKVWGKNVNAYPKKRVDDMYEDFMFYDCSPELYRMLLKTRG